jgi:diketogulonate reductase-like aldo/keto reductase
MENPRIGLGTCRANDPVILDQALTYAIEEVEHRYIDTAHAYENEEIIGSTLQRIFFKRKNQKIRYIYHDQAPRNKHETRKS